MAGTMFDFQNQLCVAQAFTGGATVSASSYAKQSAAQDISIGRRMALLVMSNGVAAADGASTHTLEAIQADDADLTSNVEVLNTVAVPSASLALGEQVEVPIPQGVMTKKYLGFRHTAAGGAANTATLDVYLVPQDEIAKYKPFTKVNDAQV